VYSTATVRKTERKHNMFSLCFAAYQKQDIDLKPKMVNTVVSGTEQVEQSPSSLTHVSTWTTAWTTVKRDMRSKQ